METGRAGAVGLTPRVYLVLALVTVCRSIDSLRTTLRSPFSVQYHSSGKDLVGIHHNRRSDDCRPWMSRLSKTSEMYHFYQHTYSDSHLHRETACVRHEVRA